MGGIADAMLWRDRVFILRPHSPPPHKAVSGVRPEQNIAPAKRRREEGEKEKEEGGRGKDGERGEKEQAGRRRGAPAWDNLISQNLSLRLSEVGHAGAQKRWG